MGGETKDLVRASFRFRRGSDTYLARPEGRYWNVTLEGNTSAYMFWVLSDEDISKNCLEHRLTD